MMNNLINLGNFYSMLDFKMQLSYCCEEETFRILNHFQMTYSNFYESPFTNITFLLGLKQNKNMFLINAF